MKVEQSLIRCLGRPHTNLIKDPLAQDIKWKLENVQLIPDDQLNKLLGSLENLRGIPYKSLNLLCEVILPGGDKVQITKDNVTTFFNNDSNNASLAIKNSDVNAHIAHHNLQKLIRYIESEIGLRQKRSDELVDGIKYVSFLSFHDDRRISFENIKAAARKRLSKRRESQEQKKIIEEEKVANREKDKLLKLFKRLHGISQREFGTYQVCRELSRMCSTLNGFPSVVVDESGNFTDEAIEFIVDLASKSVGEKFSNDYSRQEHWYDTYIPWKGPRQTELFLFTADRPENSVGDPHSDFDQTFNAILKALLGDSSKEVESYINNNEKNVRILLKHIINYMESLV
ncbi:MAG: hypothetical protein QNJ31_08490 [Candidatus Caenarcaniphilales bacterium]|nr:hypothetical protein [Candidatus Caenarcaniphilales bacterium]